MTSPTKPGRYLVTTSGPIWGAAPPGECTYTLEWDGWNWWTDEFIFPTSDVLDWCELPTVAEVKALRGTA